MADCDAQKPPPLTWNDVEFWPDGTARITIQQGKNQPEPTT